VIRFTDSIYINRPPSEVFDVVGTKIFETQPLWEKEVVAIRPVTPGAIGVGSKSIMERRDFGQRSEADYECVEFEKGQRIALTGDSPGVHVDFALEVVPAGEHGTKLDFELQQVMSGPMRFLEPIFRLVLPRQARRVMRNIQVMVEERAPI
jgi:Polyketide cyclase / dehydrase and lipid transport